LIEDFVLKLITGVLIYIVPPLLFKTLIASKGDVGSGGPNHPKIDLHIKLATDLGFDFKKGIDEVEIEDA